MMFTVQLIPWWPFASWISKIMRLVNFLGTTSVGSTVYLSLTTFLKMLFFSSRKLGSGLVFFSFTLFLQNQLHFCSFLSMSNFSFSMLYIGVFFRRSVRRTSSIIFLMKSSMVIGTSSLPLSQYRPRVCNCNIASATTFFVS